MDPVDGYPKPAMTKPVSHRTFPFDDQDARLAQRVGHMFAARPRQEHIARVQAHAALLAVLPVVHVHHAIEYSEYLLAIVDMPAIRGIGSVQPHRDAVQMRDVERAPGPVGGEATGLEDGGLGPTLGQNRKSRAEGRLRPTRTTAALVLCMCGNVSRCHATCHDRHERGRGGALGHWVQWGPPALDQSVHDCASRPRRRPWHGAPSS